MDTSHKMNSRIYKNSHKIMKSKIKSVWTIWIHSFYKKIIYCSSGNKDFWYRTIENQNLACISSSNSFSALQLTLHTASNLLIFQNQLFCIACKLKCMLLGLAFKALHNMTFLNFWRSNIFYSSKKRCYLQLFQLLTCSWEQKIMRNFCRHYQGFIAFYAEFLLNMLLLFSVLDISLHIYNYGDTLLIVAIYFNEKRFIVNAYVLLQKMLNFHYY